MMIILSYDDHYIIQSILWDPNLPRLSSLSYICAAAYSDRVAEFMRPNPHLQIKAMKSTMFTILELGHLNSKHVAFIIIYSWKL